MKGPRGVVVPVMLLVSVLGAAACTREAAPPTVDPPRTTSGDAIVDGLATGLDVYQAQCAVCHGTGDEGALAPSLREGLLGTFIDCSDQIDLITIGADNWPSDTYGDTNRPIGAYDLVMPGFGLVLDGDEIATVNFWVRVELAGEGPAVAAAGCGVSGP